MNSILVVANDTRIPPELESFGYDFWNLEKFIEEASSEEGLPLYDKIYFNIDSVNYELYSQLSAPDSELLGKLKYYTFIEEAQPAFNIAEGFSLYKEVTPEPEPEPIQEIHGEQPSLTPEPVKQEVSEQTHKDSVIDNIPIIDDPVVFSNSEELDPSMLINIVNAQNTAEGKKTKGPAKVILFGSSKGGTGKSTTCLITARRYAKTHPDKRVALADFDIIDGQIGISILRPHPTLREYYKQYIHENIGFQYLNNVHINNEHFSPNLDFYLAPPIDIPEVTNNEDFWQNVFELLIMNYDVVFFDSGIDYLGKAPISKLYHIADRIILTCSTSINAVYSVVKQIQNLKGQNNNVFKPEWKIADKLHVVLTRAAKNNSTNDVVVKTITAEEVPIIAVFGNLDDMINRSQWWQQWEVWDNDSRINQYLDRIANID